MKISRLIWLRISLYIIACGFSAYSVFANKVLFALLASLTLFLAFFNLKNNLNTPEQKFTFTKYELTSDQWVLSIALFTYALLSGIVAAFLSAKISLGTISLVLWVISIGILCAAGVIFDKIQPFKWITRLKSMDSKSRRGYYLEATAIIALSALALALRVTFLDRYPPSMHGDEGEMGMEALRFLGIGEPISPMGIGWGPLPNLYYLWQAGSIAILGRNLVGLRLVSALFGSACVPLVYLIGKRSWGKLAGFTGAFLMAVSALHIQYSRLAVNNIESAFFMLLFVYLFIKSNFDRKSNDEDVTALVENHKFKISPYIAMGITGALAQYMYLGSRLIPLVAFPLILVQLFKKRINIVQLSVLIISAIIVFAPLGLDYVRNPEQLTSRMSTVSIFNPDNIRNNYGQDATLSNSILKIAVTQFNKNFGFFLQSGDAGSFYFHSIPAFDLITAFLFWLGLGIIFARPKRLPELVIIIWFLLGIILAGVITNDSPNGTRLLIVTSVAYICGGAFVQRTWDSMNHFYKQIPNIHISLGWMIAPIYIGVLIAAAMINFNTYFRVYAKSGVGVLPLEMAKEIIRDSSEDHVYLLGDGDLYTRHGTIQFLVGNGVAQDITALDQIPPLEKDGKGITILATVSNFEKLKEIQTLFPDGVFSEEIQNGEKLFERYEIQALK